MYSTDWRSGLATNISLSMFHVFNMNIINIIND